MGKFSSSSGNSKSKKSKGPKGKKARAKAKLDRQWGEAVIDDGSSGQKHRGGKSRLLSSRTTKATNNETETFVNEPSFHERIQHYKQGREESYFNSERNHEKDQRMLLDDDDSDSSTSSRENSFDEQEDMEETPMMSALPMTNLLESIQKTNKKNRKKQRQQTSSGNQELESRRNTLETSTELDDDAMEDNEESDDSASASSSSSAMDNDTDDSSEAERGSDGDDDESVLEEPNEDGANQLDLFGQRFNQDTSSERRVDDSPSSSNTTTKVPINDMLELQHTASSFAKDGKADPGNSTVQSIHALIEKFADQENNNKNKSSKSRSQATDKHKKGKNSQSRQLTKEQWQEVSNLTYNSNIRQVLQRQWKKEMKQKKKLNKSAVFTPSQSHLYPFLSRYNDLLLTTTESPKVRKFMWLMKPSLRHATVWLSLTTPFDLS